MNTDEWPTWARFTARIGRTAAVAIVVAVSLCVAGIVVLSSAMSWTP